MPVEVPLNIPAILVAALAQFVLGFLWFGPIFGKIWIKMMGMTKQQIDAAKKKGMAKEMVLAAVGAVVMSFVLAHSLAFAGSYLQISGASAGLQAGFWNWLGFIAPVTLSSVLWEGKSWSLWVLNNGYWLVGLCLMGVIQAMWA